MSSLATVGFRAREVTLGTPPRSGLSDDAGGQERRAPSYPMLFD
jgi:hypothetical protein